MQLWRVMTSLTGNERKPMFKCFLFHNWTKWFEYGDRREYIAEKKDPVIVGKVQVKTCKDCNLKKFKQWRINDY